MTDVDRLRDDPDTIYPIIDEDSVKDGQVVDPLRQALGYLKDGQADKAMLAILFDIAISLRGMRGDDDEEEGMSFSEIGEEK